MWEGFASHLREMSDEDFRKQRQSLIDQRLEKPKNLGQETSRYWSQCDNGEYDFFRRQRHAAAIAQVTPADMLDFFSTFISPSSSSRSSFSIHMRSQRFQLSSLDNLLQAVESAQPDSQTSHREFFETKPTLSEVRAYLAKVFVKGLPAEISDALALIEEGAALPKGVTDVVDVEGFRSKLARADKVPPRDEFEKDLGAHL